MCGRITHCIREYIRDDFQLYLCFEMYYYGKVMNLVPLKPAPADKNFRLSQKLYQRETYLNFFSQYRSTVSAAIVSCVVPHTSIFEGLYATVGHSSQVLFNINCT